MCYAKPYWRLGVKPKDQVAYIPTHANKDLQHPDVEFGFVTSDLGRSTVLVRYWAKGQNGTALRTRANSEATPRDCLVPYESATPGEVDAAWRAWVL